jgi:hypothetical protein
MLRQDHRLKVLENTLLRKIRVFGPQTEVEQRDKGNCIAKSCVM